MRGPEHMRQVWVLLRHWVQPGVEQQQPAWKEEAVEVAESKDAL